MGFGAPKVLLLRARRQVGAEWHQRPACGSKCPAELPAPWAMRADGLFKSVLHAQRTTPGGLLTAFADMPQVVSLGL